MDVPFACPSVRDCTLKGATASSRDGAGWTYDHGVATPGLVLQVRLRSGLLPEAPVIRTLWRGARAKSVAP